MVWLICVVNLLYMASGLRSAQSAVQVPRAPKAPLCKTPVGGIMCKEAIQHFDQSIDDKPCAKWYPQAFKACVDARHIDVELLRDRQILMVGNSVMRAQYFEFLSYLLGTPSPDRSMQKKLCYKEDDRHQLPPSYISCHAYCKDLNTTVFFRFEGYMDGAAQSLAHVLENGWADHPAGKVAVANIDTVIMQLGANHLLRPTQKAIDDNERDAINMTACVQGNSSKSSHLKSQSSFEADLEEAITEVKQHFPNLLKVAFSLVNASSAARIGENKSAQVLLKTVTPLIPSEFGSREYWDCSGARNDFVATINALLVELASEESMGSQLKIVDDFNTVWAARRGSGQTHEDLGYEDFIHPAGQLRATLLLQTLCALQE
mmetsp:Transcript_20662/g.59862  ORF Transcript_20662/g.59862 Transcript_20662/m.59862 type:complete len:375 (+) Transcript_20662:68-1192(+)|eukprot:CAMPEP_0168393368 /NCGR_PEP_ID=MMETSP0228-20121227/18982_1 /TAXON_ID=133427 /ORGANISM="Protoceratium reticulatum, Strain CCCM 535 (=CCMP 1889)" /LENGTH=374 /DNA_ID=CAMNT_0008406747 /DNA_START=68 /DNA_END=1192 /DNA_ORIENTATION=-